MYEIKRDRKECRLSGNLLLLRASHRRQWEVRLAGKVVGGQHVVVHDGEEKAGAPDATLIFRHIAVRQGRWILLVCDFLFNKGATLIVDLLHRIYIDKNAWTFFVLQFRAFVFCFTHPDDTNINGNIKFFRPPTQSSKLEKFCGAKKIFVKKAPLKHDWKSCSPQFDRHRPQSIDVQSAPYSQSASLLQMPDPCLDCHRRDLTVAGNDDAFVGFR